MARKFTITTPAETVRLDSEGRGDTVFNVANTSGAPQRALVRVVALGATEAAWLSLRGEAEREFPAGGVHQFTVSASVPPGAPAGRYSYRLHLVSAHRSGEEYEEGPVVGIEVAASAPKTQSRWWIWAAAAALLAVIGAGAWLLLRPAPHPPPVDKKALVPRDGIALWLIADDALASPAGGPIDTWRNPEFAGVYATASGNARPTVVSNVQNGHAVIRFDGIDDILSTNIDISPERMPSVTIFSVFTTATSESTPYRKVYGNDDGGFDRAAGLDGRVASTGNNYAVFTGRGGTVGYGRVGANELRLTTDYYAPNSFSGWINGTPALLNVPASWGTALPNLYIGGTGPRYGEHWLGDIAEMIVYSRALTEEERRLVESYLASRYARSLH